MFLHKEVCIEQVRKAIDSAYKIRPPIQILDQCPKTGLALKTPCYMAFFAAIDSGELLWNTFQDTQREILRTRSERGSDWPRDLNLVLLLLQEASATSAIVREILDDRYVCRKFVIQLNGQDVGDVLVDLPFWPADDLFEATGVTLAEGVQRAIKGYDPRLIGDFANYSPGAQRIFEKIVQEAYSLSSDLSKDETSVQPRVMHSSQTRLQAIDITDFRGIRRLAPESLALTGDVVFVYGPNGVGKTSIADAVEWAITGQVSRLERFSRTVQSKTDPFVNVFSNTGQARVICQFSNRESICRISSNRSSARFIGEHKVPDDRAVIDHVVGTRAPSSDARLGIQQLRDLFRGSHMLSQHDLRAFLEDTKATDRFDILTKMIGAEEFVRFREKVSTVFRRLHSEIATANEQKNSLKRNLDDISSRLRERKKEIEKLSHAVTEGVKPDDLIANFLDSLRHYGCLRDEDAVRRADGQPIEHRLELVSVHADSWIRAKRAEIDELLVSVESLQQGLSAYLESLTRCESLKAEIEQARATSEKWNRELINQEEVRRNFQTAFNNLKARQSKAAKRLGDLSWLHESLPGYHERRQRLESIQNSLSVSRDKAENSASALQEQQKLINAKRARHKEIEQLIATKENRYQGLALLKQRLTGVQAVQREMGQLADREKQRDLRMKDLRQQASSAGSEYNESRARIEKLQKAYESEASRHDLLSSLLVRLSQTLQTPECPLCGRGFASVDEAMRMIQEHLSTMPISLKEAARHLEEEKDKAETKRKEVLAIDETIRSVETEVKIIRSKKTEAASQVQAFIAECGSWGLRLPPDLDTWQKTVDEALNECQAPDLHTEKVAVGQVIESLASSISEMQKMVDAARQKASQDDRLVVQITAELKTIESEMRQRGFDWDLLPDNERVAAEISQTQREIEQLNSQIANADTEAQRIESAAATLQASLRKIKEDAASKTSQMSHFESIRTHFVASCRSKGLDPGNAMESFESARLKSSEVLKSLSILDSRRQGLGQVATLMRLKREMNSLEFDQDQADQQYQSSVVREAGLREWESRIRNLETEVAKRQVDAVSSHLVRLEPTSQRLYRRLNPHPVFGGIKIKVDGKTREFDVEAQTLLVGNDFGTISVSPSVFFSEAQMNGLAITVFLAGALRQRWSYFDTILIDDPVQQMDDMNVSAFLDLLRGLSDWRQFIIFTCSRDFYLLALEKLESMNKCKKGSFVGYRLEGIAPSQLRVTCDTG